MSYLSNELSRAKSGLELATNSLYELGILPSSHTELSIEQADKAYATSNVLREALAVVVELMHETGATKWTMENTKVVLAHIEGSDYALVSKDEDSVSGFQNTLAIRRNNQSVNVLTSQAPSLTEARAYNLIQRHVNKRYAEAKAQGK